MLTHRTTVIFAVCIALVIISCFQTRTTVARDPGNPKPRIKIGPLSQIHKSIKIQSQQGIFKGMKCCVTRSYPCLKNSDCCSNMCQHTSQIAGEKRRSSKARKTSKAIPKTHMGGPGTRLHHPKARPSVNHPVTRGTSPALNTISVPSHHYRGRYPLNSQPLIGDKLVVAKGSHRALVLTHGGIRCNDFIREVEQNIM